MADIAVREVREGTGRFLVPETKGPPSAGMPVFYNPLSEMRRDISVAMLGAFEGRFKKRAEILDALCASGISGIRYALESGLDCRATLCDHNPAAIGIAEKNIALNGAKNAVALKRDAAALMSERFFDIIDIDPFGPPVPYLDPALRNLKIGGLLFATATDTAALCGTKVAACERRYHSRPARVSFAHEIGLRTLLGYIARTAAKYESAISPALSYFADHYYRVFVSTRHGNKAADESLANVGHIIYDPETLERNAVPGFFAPCVDGCRGANARALAQGPHRPPPPKSPKGGRIAIGPLWIGPLHDRAALGRVRLQESFGARERLAKLLPLWAGEAEMPPYFFTTMEIAQRYRVEQPGPGALAEKLRASGYSACRTHLHPSGVKTDASARDVVAAVLEMS